MESDMNALAIAVRMQGSKRTLRSNDIAILVENDKVDQNLDISFTIQYPHFVKRKGNYMLLMLQRRKKYKARPIPGFKTLAIGTIDMTEVIQQCNDHELILYSEGEAIARVQLSSLVTQPIEQEEKHRENEGLYTDEDDDDVSSDGGSDSEAQILDPPTADPTSAPSDAAPVSARHKRQFRRNTNISFADRGNGDQAELEHDKSVQKNLGTQIMRIGVIGTICDSKAIYLLTGGKCCIKLENMQEACAVYFCQHFVWGSDYVDTVSCTMLFYQWYLCDCDVANPDNPLWKSSCKHVKQLALNVQEFVTVMDRKGPC